MDLRASSSSEPAFNASSLIVTSPSLLAAAAVSKNFILIAIAMAAG